jgi:G3E family GTPase
MTAELPAQRIPVHVVTGFLGSGKTTLLNEMLRHEGFARTAVIINEFGETGLDHLFIEGREDGIVELSNGCLCCAIRGELAATLAALPVGRIDRVIVETTGLADPVPVLQAIIAAPQVAARFEAAALVTIVDALNLPRQLAAHKEARMQAALADLLIVTKLDLVPEGEREARLAKIVSELRELNPSAPIVPRSQIPLSPALFALAAVPRERETAPPAGHHHHHHDVNRHGETIRSIVLRTDRPMPRQAAEMFCELMTSAHADGLLRLKGLVAIEGEAGPLLVHAIHGVLHEPRQLSEWPGGIEGTRLVAILDGLDPVFVERLFAGFANVALPDTPDRAALTGNPLAIPGYRA